MDTYGSHEGYLYNLHTCSPAEAKRLWKESIKNQWNNECAYCGSKENLSLDHVIPQCKGGSNHATNLVAACVSCNGDKAHEDWIIWYIQQPFFTEERREAIERWIESEEEDVSQLSYKPSKELYKYGSRRNKAYWPSLLHHYMDYHPKDPTLPEVRTLVDDTKSTVGGGLLAIALMLVPFIILL